MTYGAGFKILFRPVGQRGFMLINILLFTVIILAMCIAVLMEHIKYLKNCIACGSFMHVSRDEKGGFKKL